MPLITTKVYPRPVRLFALLIAGVTALFATLALALDAGVVATVNGEAVQQSTVQAVERQLQGRQQKPDRAQIINELVNLKLLAQLASKDGLHDSEEIRSVLELQRLQVLANAYMAKISEDIELPDEALRAEYDQQVGQVEQSEMRASQILLETEDAAREVINALASGEAFDELAKTKSIDPSGKSGGDLGWFQPNAMPVSLVKALEKLGPGEYTRQPVNTEFGWHVMKLDDRRGTPVPAFEEVKPQLRNAMVARELQGKIAELREQAEIDLGE